MTREAARVGRFENTSRSATDRLVAAVESNAYQGIVVVQSLEREMSRKRAKQGELALE